MVALDGHVEFWHLCNLPLPSKKLASYTWAANYSSDSEQNLASSAVVYKYPTKCFLHPTSLNMSMNCITCALAFHPKRYPTYHSATRVLLRWRNCPWIIKPWALWSLPLPKLHNQKKLTGGWWRWTLLTLKLITLWHMDLQERDRWGLALMWSHGK